MGRLQRAGAGLVARRTVRTHPQVPVRVEVACTVDLTPSMRRVTLTGPGLRDYPVLGSDHYARLLLPRPGQREPVLPASARWYPELLAMVAAVRPVLRNYTLRDVRPQDAEVDIDFVRHPGNGPASTWAATAQPGEVIGLVEQGVLFTPDPVAGHLLLVADDTGLPALGSMLAGLPSGLRVTAVVEVGGAQDEQPLPSAADVHLTWLHRGRRLRPGQLLLAHPLPRRAGRGQTWLAGEAAMATGLRRRLVRDLGHDRSGISFTGYYRLGRAQY